MKKKIAFIIPYFGRFNNYFPLFLKSCEKNRDICDWLIFTDDHTKYDYPDNVLVVYMTWEEMKIFMQKKFNFTLALTNPYKLCDFRPAYGYIFEEYIQDYDYWGHCDTDLIWGKINNFWDEELFSKYKKIFNLGHCTIYQNEEENNKIFFRLLNGKDRYREVYKSKENCSFDEEYNQSINCIYYYYDIPVYEESFAANLYTKTSDFQLTTMKDSHDGYWRENKCKNFFVWSEGELNRYMCYKDVLKKQEFLYIHFQSRRMRIKVRDLKCKEFKIVPNVFEDLEIPVKDIEISKLNKIKTKYINMHYFTLRVGNLVKKIKKIGKK